MRYSWYLDNQHVDELWCYHNNLFTPEECEKIITIGHTPELVDLDYASVGGSDDGKVDFNIRKSTIGWVPIADQTVWIFQKLTDAINGINKGFFNYELSHIENLQFTMYKDDGEYYGKHIDMMYKSNATRKLSFSVQLTDPSDYEGGEFHLIAGKDPNILPKDRGTCLFFPSWSLHEVTPVTQGTRYALVGWVCGPRFK